MSEAFEAGSSVESSKTDANTTTFANDGVTASKSFVSKIDTIPIPMAKKTLASFFEKPVQVFNGVAATSDTPNTSLYTVNISSLLAANPVWQDKIEGFGLVRGTACFKVKINATPFHAGRWRNIWLPGAPQAVGPAYATLHNTTMTCRYQLPGLDVDAREGGSEFKIPYIAPTSWFQVKNDTKYPSYDWGTYDFVTLSPLQIGSGADSSISVVIYAWFEDIELAQPLITQSSGARSKTKLRSYGSVSQKEADGAGAGTISGGLKSVSMAATALSSIPMLAPVAGPAAWVTDIMSGVASAFGWSKPDLNPTPGLMVKQFNRYMATSDGIDSAIPLALKCNHAITPSDGTSVRAEDEMSFAFLKSVETCTNADPSNQIFWTDSQAAGSYIIQNMLIAPCSRLTSAGALASSHSVIHNSETATYFCGPPFWYLSNKFKHYRGSLRLRIQIVKTDFHTGSFMIVWTPGHLVDTAPTLTNSAFALREIIDIRDGNEVCFTLPWMIEYDYLDVQDYYGRLDIIVVNKLVRPDAASSSVQLLFIWSAADDFELALPVGVNNLGYSDVPFSPEMDSSTTQLEEVICEPVGGVSRMNMTLGPAEASMGELFTDVKQLLGRYTRVLSSQSAAFSSTQQNLFIYPWFCNVAYMNTSGVLSGNNSGGDAYSYFGPMYAFYRGDVRVAITQSEGSTSSPEQATNNPIYAMVYPRALPWSGNAITTTSINNILSNAAGPFGTGTKNWYAQQDQIPNTDLIPSGIGVGVSDAGVGYSNWKIPYYSRCKMSYLWPASSTQEVVADLSQPTGAAILHGAVGTWTDYLLQRSVSDEFHFHFFLGAPPLLYNILP